MPAGWVPRANYPTYVWFGANLVLPLICEADEVLQLLGCSSLAQAVESVRVSGKSGTEPPCSCTCGQRPAVRV